MPDTTPQDECRHECRNGVSGIRSEQVRIFRAIQRAAQAAKVLKGKRFDSFKVELNKALDRAHKAVNDMNSELARIEAEMDKCWERKQNDKAIEESECLCQQPDSSE